VKEQPLEPIVTILQPDTPSGLSSIFRTGFGLPTELREKAQRRLAILAGIFAVNALIAILIAPAIWARLGLENLGTVQVVQVVFLVSSAAMFGMARFGPAGHPRILDLGLVYEVTLCFIGALGESIVFGGSGRVPLTTLAHVVIVAYPLIIPSPPSRTLIAALAAGATVPASLAFLNTLDIGASLAPASFVAPTVWALFSVAVAVVGSHIVYGLTRDAARARELGSYKLHTLLGAGGMGEVWQAKHRLLARPAAIKLVKPEALGGDATSQQQVLARFEREAQATASLRSPHTIELYDFGVSETGTFYYVMELLNGFDATELVEKFGPLPPARVVYLLTQVCDSLGEAHEAGLVHRDVKPSNVFVCRYGRQTDFVKLLDFGLVKPYEAGTSPQLTADHGLAGTPAFMAPEQVLGHTVDGRTDLYAVGCVAYWLLTGQYVFRASNAMELIARHLHTEPEAPSCRTNTKIPPGLDALVLACLAKDAADRPQTADDLASALMESVSDGAWSHDQAAQWWGEHVPSEPFGAR